MAQSEESRKLERRARSLMTTKVIPSAKMDIVRSLMNNSDIIPDERYSAIIELLQGCEDREVRETVDMQQERKPAARRRVPGPANGGEQAPSGDYSPTETSFYVDDLLRRYRHLKLFKKRYLVRRNNRFNLGFRKRIIPTRKFLRLLQDLYAMQESLVARISPVTMDILNDESIEDPTVFNYLRQIRAWLLEEPLGSQGFDSVKWMERASFEREFRQYLYNCLAFRRLGAELKEAILLQFENKLRAMEDLKKEDIFNNDPDPVKREKEKRNLSREKKIYEYMLLFRAFMYGEMEEGNTLSDHLKLYYRVESFNSLLMMIIEVLVYQRPVTAGEFVSRYSVRAPEVSSELWNYSEDYLKKVGKDPESRRAREREHVKERLGSYELIYKMLKVEDRGINILSRAAETQWKQVDKNKNDPETTFRENFMLYLDAVVQFFKNTFILLLNGSEIKFRDQTRDEFLSAVFSREVFMDEVASFEKLLNEIHAFRSNNPTMAVSREEAVKIMKGQINSMNHVHDIISGTGEFFYAVAHRLLEFYNEHRRWIFQGSPRIDRAVLRGPVKPVATGEAGESRGRGPSHSLL